MFANTWTSIYRGDDETNLADITDLDTPVPGLEQVPAAITEKTRTVYDRETSEPRIIRYGVGRLQADTDVRVDDRLYDVRTGRWWTVRAIVDRGSTFIGSRSVECQLRAV